MLRSVSGDHEGGDDRVLRHKRVLRAAPVVVRHLGEHLSLVRRQDQGDGLRELLLSDVRVGRGPREGEGARARLRSRGMGERVQYLGMRERVQSLSTRERML